MSHGRVVDRRAMLLVCIATLAGCAGNHAAFNPASPEAARIDRLWWLFFDVSVVVYVLVMGALVYALVRRRRQLGEDSTSRVAVSAAVGVTVAVLLVLAVSDFLTQHAMARPQRDALRIQLIGHQWWWEMVYDDPDPSHRFHTANELHVPANRPVQLIMTSEDVIHSFWLPNVQGKKDLIPGRVTTASFTADRQGLFEGQCAEFCGYQHAKMRLVLHVDSQDTYNAWMARQQQPGHSPATDDQRHGQEVFLRSSCSLCHAVVGTDAQATVGPDLTHLAGRGTIAAGVLPNTSAHLERWITDPQGIKPGVQMPPSQLLPQDLQALVTYLGSLE